MSEQRKPISDEELQALRLVRIEGVIYPADRADQERALLKHDEEFRQKYANPEGVATLETQVEAFQNALDRWKKENPLVAEYLGAIEIWKQGSMPIFAEDKEKGQQAEARMREIEKEGSIQFSDLRWVHYTEKEFKERGYTDKQIKFLQTYHKGRTIEAKLSDAQHNLNHARTLTRKE